MSNKKIFWLAGEKSGDTHASFVLKQIISEHPEYEHFGAGGPQMEKYGFKPLFPFHKFNVMGFAEVLKHIRFFYRTEKKICDILDSEKPDLLILVDYPGLNLRIAKEAFMRRIPVLYFISPQFWAWKHKRVYKLAEFTTSVASIIPFEADLLRSHRCSAEYVGHPISEEINFTLSRQQFAEKFNLNPDKEWIGYFPGSRDQEIEKMLPVFLESLQKLDYNKYQALISKSSSVSNKLFADILKKYDLPDLKIADSNNYDMMRLSKLLVLTSGTATLEAAYIGTPSIITYKTNKISYEIGKRIVKIKHIGLPNIVMEKSILPELIQDDASPENIYSACIKLLENENEYNKLKDELKEVRQILGSKKCSVEVSRMVNELLNR
ncbi:MAG: lipid-A-disaccharide synthase [Candidatus Cloacimonadota bacterium]|nr:MAG: lipid-A-disaccharide synthase [Candidatus Cloacimonadota bacterium]